MFFVKKFFYKIFVKRNGEKCLFEESNIGATLTSYKTLPSGDEKALQNAVATIGPISVAIDASRPTFHFYKKGLYHEPGKNSTYVYLQKKLQFLHVSLFSSLLVF